jgi:putative NIF3 family GTP cyclohydrolase 1 type 2
MKALQKLILSFFFICLTVLIMGQNQVSAPKKSAAEIIGSVIKNTGASTILNTVDIIKEGDPQTEVSGIVTSMFATMAVLKEAVKKNCNLIIVHEPLYYNHLDETKQFAANKVFLEKQQYINEHKLVIWRFHDYIHSMNPDGVEMGMIAKLGWKDYAATGRLDRFVLPATTLNGLLQTLKKVFPKNAFYVVGKPDLKLTNVALAPGAPGSMYHISLLEDSNIDVIIAGESPQWETYEYMRDAVDQGRNKAVIFIGHISSEEAGMDYSASWLKGFIKNMPIYYVESGPAYWSY